VRDSGVTETPFTYEQVLAWLSSHPLEPDRFKFQCEAGGFDARVVPGMIEVLASGPFELHRAAGCVLAFHRIGTKSYGSTVEDFEYRLFGPGRNERVVRPQHLKATDMAELAFISVDPLRRFDEYPPLDFSLTGLSQCLGPRWVTSFEGFPSFGVRSVYLAHSVEDGGLIVVKTAHRQRWDDDHGGGNRTGSEDSDRLRTRNSELFARVLVLFIVDSTRPELQGEDRSYYKTGIYPFVDSHAEEWRRWESAQWSLGEQSLDARVFRFADGWTGFSVDDPDRYIAVAAYNVADTNVRLEEVDGAAYDFDFSMPFTIEQLRAHTDTKPDVASLMRARTKHPNHEAVSAASPWFQYLVTDRIGRTEKNPSAYARPTDVGS